MAVELQVLSDDGNIDALLVHNLTLVCISRYFSQRKDERKRVGLPCNHQIEILYGKASDDKSPLGIDKAVEICKCFRGWIRSDRRSVDPHTYAIMGSYMYNRWVITLILELTFHLLLKIFKYFISVVHFP